MAKEQEPIEALEKKSIHFRMWISGGHDVSSGLIDSPCPKCGGRVVCAYAEMGALDFYDTYAHGCLNPDSDYGETETFSFIAIGGLKARGQIAHYVRLLKQIGLIRLIILNVWNN